MMTNLFPSTRMHLGMCLIILLCSYSTPAFAAEETISIDVSGGMFQDGNARHVVSVGWLAQFLREKGWNVVLSPEVKDVRIPELKLRNANVRLIADALTIATGRGVSASVRDGNTLFLIGGRKQKLEAFNLSGYLETLSGNNPGPSALERIKIIIFQSLTGMGESVLTPPTLNFYSEAKILVAIGSPEALEVTRKIVEALPGQQPQQKLMEHQLLDLTSEPKQN